MEVSSRRTRLVNLLSIRVAVLICSDVISSRRTLLRPTEHQDLSVIIFHQDARRYHLWMGVSLFKATLLPPPLASNPDAFRGEFRVV